jgi:hypothetical protein
MSDAEQGPSQRLRDFIYAALEVGVGTVRATDGGMHPFLMVPGEDKPSYTRFVGESLEECLHNARQAAGRLADGVPAYAVAADGYLTADEEKFDAVLVEGGERGCPVGFVFAQRYRPGEGRRKFKVIGRPTLVKEVPSRFPTDAANRCLILFRGSDNGLEDARRLLASRRLTVTRRGGALAVRWRRGRPVLFIRFTRGKAVRREARWLAAGTPHGEQLGNCDAMYEITFKDLEKVLDEINSLIEVQWTLQDATQGYTYRAWNGILSAPGE